MDEQTKQLHRYLTKDQLIEKLITYEKGFNILVHYFDYIPEEEKDQVDNKLKELNLWERIIMHELLKDIEQLEIMHQALSNQISELEKIIVDKKQQFKEYDDYNTKQMEKDDD